MLNPKYKITLKNGKELEAIRLRTGMYYGEGNVYHESDIKDKVEVKEESTK